MQYNILYIITDAPCFWVGFTNTIWAPTTNHNNNYIWTVRATLFEHLLKPHVYCVHLLVLTKRRRYTATMPAGDIEFKVSGCQSASRA